MIITESVVDELNCEKSDSLILELQESDEFLPSKSRLVLQCVEQANGREVFTKGTLTVILDY